MTSLPCSLRCWTVSEISRRFSSRLMPRARWTWRSQVLPKMEIAGFLRYAFLFLFLEEGHHRAQFLADLFDRLGLRGFAHSQEFLAARLVLLNPLAREFAGLDLRQNLLHLGAGLVIHDAWAAGVI